MALHRSGSSATAGIMHHLGINMGDELIRARDFNPKGLFENVHFMRLNHQILRKAGGSWHKPPTKEAIKSVSFNPRTIRFFFKEQVKPVWGLKDPRLLITYEYLQPYFQEISSDITYVFVHRPYQSSVKSLAHRDRISQSKADKILSRYYENFKLFRGGFGIPENDIIDVYFEDLVKDPNPFVYQLNEKIGQHPTHRIENVQSFIDKKLKKF
ncbi:hypothetical protein BKP37_17850 [Anaerobacillus alkalilacustris]|uniref:Sulfotransferase family protein n=2 Tax=Anaerobacillus alkalilacustris TaxID=393763 RepID=A0A1S2LGL4_9BACI|nr:hypothetical protein BKP37_17850 [Anaerobacillus alkalilacustris]